MSALAGRKVLIVDDEPYILKILSFKLRLNGMIPFEATCADDALRVLAEEKLDVVLLDVTLAPGPNGFELCKAIKENPSTAHLPILMLTARNQPSERELGLKLGARSYITKPFSTKVLITEIEQALISADGGV